MVMLTSVGDEKTSKGGLIAEPRLIDSRAAPCHLVEQIQEHSPADGREQMGKR
jgi:hypothetical protein